MVLETDDRRKDTHEGESTASPVLLHRHGDIVVHAATFQESSPLIQELADVRARSFDTSGPWRYGLDDYDMYGRHIVMSNASTGKIIGGMRVGLGDEIIDSLGAEGLYVNTFWHLHPKALDLLRNGVECGRVWMSKEHKEVRSDLFHLWKGFSMFLEQNPQYSFIFGTVSLVDLSPEQLNQLLHYLSERLTTVPDMLTPRVPVVSEGCVDQAEGSLEEVLSGIGKNDTQNTSITLLKRYIHMGANLLGEVATDETSRKVYIPLAGNRASLTQYTSR